MWESVKFRKMSPWLQTNFMSLAVLFAITGLVSMLPLTALRNTDNILLMPKNMFFVTGLNIKVTWDCHFASAHFCRRFRRPSRKNLLLNGTSNSSNNILGFNWGSLLVLTQNEPSASIVQPLMSTLCSLDRFWMRRKFHGVMSTTWMRRDVSEVVAGRCRLSNTLFPIPDDLTISCEVVTIIECVCTDETSLLPGFIFSGKEFHPEWFQADDNLRYVHLYQI
jgi:hypothetical protein